MTRGDEHFCRKLRNKYLLGGDLCRTSKGFSRSMDWESERIKTLETSSWILRREEEQSTCWHENKKAKAGLNACFAR